MVNIVRVSTTGMSNLLKLSCTATAKVHDGFFRIGLQGLDGGIQRDNSSETHYVKVSKSSTGIKAEVITKGRLSGGCTQSGKACFQTLVL